MFLLTLIEKEKVSKNTMPAICWKSSYKIIWMLLRVTGQWESSLETAWKIIVLLRWIQKVFCYARVLFELHTSIKKQLDKIDGWSRDGSTKKHTNKGSRPKDNNTCYIPIHCVRCRVHARMHPIIHMHVTDLSKGKVFETWSGVFLVWICTRMFLKECFEKSG